jgi:hypothetical protein
VLCLAREVDLVDSWNPAMAQVAELSTHSINELLAYLALWVPWPMSTPEVVVRGVGADLLDVTGAVLLACAHVPELPVGGVGWVMVVVGAGGRAGALGHVAAGSVGRPRRGEGVVLQDKPRSLCKVMASRMCLAR